MLRKERIGSHSQFWPVLQALSASALLILKQPDPHSTPMVFEMCIVR